MNRALLIAVASLGALAAGLLAGRLLDTAGPEGPVTQRATVLDVPRALPAFSLVADDGGALDADRLKGNWTLVFFGFTHCPDICPTTLATVARAIDDVPAGERPQVLLVSVDPERDTPEKLDTYLGYFDPAFLGATGDLDAIEAFATSVGAVFMHTPDDGGGYTVDHSAALFLLDPQVRLAAVFSAPHSAQEIGPDLSAIRAARQGRG